MNFYPLRSNRVRAGRDYFDNVSEVRKFLTKEMKQNQHALHSITALCSVKETVVVAQSEQSLDVDSLDQVKTLFDLDPQVTSHSMFFEVHTQSSSCLAEPHECSENLNLDATRSSYLIGDTETNCQNHQAGINSEEEHCGDDDGGDLDRLPLLAQGKERWSPLSSSPEAPIGTAESPSLEVSDGEGSVYSISRQVDGWEAVDRDIEGGQTSGGENEASFQKRQRTMRLNSRKNEVPLSPVAPTSLSVSCFHQFIPLS